MLEELLKIIHKPIRVGFNTYEYRNRSGSCNSASQQEQFQ